jgi:cell division protein FtsW
MRLAKIRTKGIDLKFLITLGLLLVFGLFVLSSASFVAGQKKFGDSQYYLREQFLKGMIIGIVGFLIFSRIPLEFLRKYSFIFLILSIGLTMMVFLPQVGLSHSGSTRWLNFGSFTFQPSELLKLSFLIYLASWFESRQRDLNSFNAGLLPFLIITGIIALLLLMQPSFGTFAVIALSAATVYFVAGGRIMHIISIGFIGLVLFFVFVFLKPYGAERLQVFLNSQKDVSGAAFQINQALMSIGSGGVKGIGINQSLSSAYLPESIGDSIFAVLAEKLGLFGVSVSLLLYVLFAIFSCQIALKSVNSFSKFLAAGITSWILIQSFINIAAISGLIPLTGMPLPFMSYGSSGLVMVMIGTGIIANISRHTI